MVNGLPLHLLDQSGQRDGDVCKHKDGEGKHVQQLLVGGDLDLLPLADDGQRAVEQQAQVEADHRGEGKASGDLQDALGDVGGLAPAGHAQHHVEGQHHHGQQHAGSHGHEHVVAGPGLAGGLAQEAPGQGSAVIGIDLIESLGPAQALIPGLAEGGGLLVVDDSLVAVADAAALQGAAHGELDVLGEQVVRPAAVLPDDIGVNEEAGAGDVAVGTQEHTGEVEEAGLTQEPDAVAGGDPVGTEVAGIAVAGNGAVVTAVKDLVHLGGEVGVHQIVGVEDHVAVVGVLALVGQGAEEVIQGVALALLVLVEALIHDGAGVPGNLGGVVGAVIGHHIDIQAVLGVVLIFQRLDQFCDHSRLVAGGDHGGVAVDHRIPVGALAVLAHQADHQIDQLIKIGHGEQHSQKQVKGFYHSNHSHVNHLDKVRR